MSAYPSPLAAVFAAACSDRNGGPTDPGLLHDFDPGPDDPGPLGTFPLPTPPGQVPGVDPESTGIVIPPGLPIKVTVAGTLTFTPNPAYFQCAGNQGTLPPWSSLGPAGWSSAPNNYRVLVSIGRNGSPLGYNTTSPSADPVIAYINGGGGGPLWAARPSTYGFQCGQNPQLLLTGSQTVTAEILAPATVTPDRSTVVTGDTVTFTVSVPWTTTFVVNGGWTWVADSAGANPTVVSGCGMHDSNCSYRIFGDGHAVAHTVHAENAVDLTGTSPTVHVAPARLTLTANPTHVASGALVTFTAHRADAGAVSVQTWVWTPGAGTPPGPLATGCSGGDSTCVTPIANTNPDSGASQTGTMTAWAVIGTASESASVAVTVDAPTGDTSGGCGLRAAPSGAVNVTKRMSATAATPSAGSATTAHSVLVRDCGGGGGGGTPGLSLSVDHDTLSPLYPRIRRDTVNSVPVPGRAPDTANITVTVTQGGSPDSNAAVTIRAEFLPGTGGHAHFTSPVRFESAPGVAHGPDSSWSVFGHFITVVGLLPSPTVQLRTPGNGILQAQLAAGFVSGRARIIASASIGDRVLVDTAIVAIGVPNLVSLETIDTSVYWIGGDENHALGNNLYMQDSVATRTRAISDSMRIEVLGFPYYLQFNDASLVDGGTFSVSSGLVTAENPYPTGSIIGHVAHDTGLDVDIGLCYANASGDDGGFAHKVTSNQCKSGQYEEVDLGVLQRQACAVHGVARAHFGTHYHIRFVGSSDVAPGC